MTKRPVEIDDLLRFQLLCSPRISPDGRRAVFSVKRIDPEKNCYYSRLWTVDTETGAPRAFTGDRQNGGSPEWSPDGAQIAFISDRKKPGAQICLIPADGGEARVLTALEEGSVRDPAWSPDGSRIAFFYRAIPEAWREDAKKEREEKGLSAPVRVHKQLQYRLDGFGYFDDSHWQIGVADAVTGETWMLTDEPHFFQSIAWSPDGKSLAIIANRRDDDDLDNQLDDLWTTPADGGELTRIPAPAGPKHGVAWSPDGRWIAFTGHHFPEEHWGARNIRVLIVPAEGAVESNDLTGSSDKSVGYLTLSDMHEVGDGPPIVWSADSRSLYFPISAFGDTRLYRVSLDGSAPAPLTPTNSEMGGFSLSRDGTKIALLLGTATDPHDIYLGSVAGDGLEMRRLTELNRDLMAEVEFQTPEAFKLDRPGGAEVHGWILKPPSVEAGRRYPAIIYVHGGPSLQYGGLSSPFHELQWLAAQGYVVLFSNPRGSKGYGEAHTSAIHGNWGTCDWDDIQAVADYGDSLPFVDSTRTAIMGGSYGGYMSAWAVGHTDRFRCAIVDRLVGNVHSMAGTSDIVWSHETYFKGNAWDDPSDLWRVSPLAYAGKIQTPVLLIHSEGDLRCPIGQAEELFAALRHQRKTVEFVRYPASASHGFSRNGPPDLRIDRLRRSLEWLDRYLK